MILGRGSREGGQGSRARRGSSRWVCNGNESGRGGGGAPSPTARRCRRPRRRPTRARRPPPRWSPTPARRRRRLVTQLMHTRGYRTRPHLPVADVDHGARAVTVCRAGGVSAGRAVAYMADHGQCGPWPEAEEYCCVITAVMASPFPQNRTANALSCLCAARKDWGAAHP